MESVQHAPLAIDLDRCLAIASMIQPSISLDLQHRLCVFGAHKRRDSALADRLQFWSMEVGAVIHCAEPSLIVALLCHKVIGHWENFANHLGTGQGNLLMFTLSAVGGSEFNKMNPGPQGAVHVHATHCETFG